MNGKNFDITGNAKYYAFAEQIAEIAKQRKVDSALTLVKQAISEFKDRKFTVAVLGMLKRGKSTFCNAMLGMQDDRYAPTGKTPVSNVVTFFEKGEPCVTVFHDDGSEAIANVEDIANYTTEEKNPQNVKKIKQVTIRDDFPKMEPGVMLLDTPGSGSIFEHHDALLYEYLPKADAVIFMVTAQTPLTESEVDFIKELKSQKILKFFFVINRKDQVDDEEMRDAIEHNTLTLGKIGLNISKMYPISAKMAMEGKWDESGMATLFSDVWEYLGPEKFRYPRFLLMTQLNVIIQPLQQGIDQEIQAGLMQQDELAKKIDMLAADGVAVEKAQSDALAQFSHEWDIAENCFFSELSQALSYVESQMTQYINGIGLLNYSTKKDCFPEEFETLVRNALQRVVDNFGKKIEEALSRFHLESKIKALSRFEKGSSTAFFGGIRETWKDRFLMAMCGPIGFVFATRTKNAVKEELRSRLPVVLNQIHQDWNTFGREEMSTQKERVRNELFNLYQLEIEPIVNALQSAMDSRSQEETGHAENLAKLRDDLDLLQKKGNELLIELAK